jgi:hypothetical protein
VYSNECGSCHVAYSASLLPGADWSRVIGALDHHYGVDASLDATALQSVARHLNATPIGAAQNAKSLPRITAQPWFRKEHDEVGAATFRSASVKSAANCSACHPGSERNDYERSIQMPGGRHHDD